MKTLSKEITRQFFLSEDGFNLLEKRWKSTLKSKDWEPSALEIFFYQFLRGKNYYKSFTPVSNKVKIENGQDPYYSLNCCFRSLYQICRSKNLNLPAIGLKIVDEVKFKEIFMSMFEEPLETKTYSRISPDFPYREYKELSKI